MYKKLIRKQTKREEQPILKDNQEIENNKNDTIKKVGLTKVRKVKDGIANGFTFLSSTVGILVLLVLIVFIFKNGIGLLKPSLVTGDYYSQNYSVKTDDNIDYNLGDFMDPNISEISFSNVWGIGFKNQQNKEGNMEVVIAYIDANSPVHQLVQSATNIAEPLKVGFTIDNAVLIDSNGQYILTATRDGADVMVNNFNKGVGILSLNASTGGGGIRGSLLTTLLLIVLTLVVALPIGIITAIYLHEYAPQNRFTNVIRALIDMTNGIPSIVFGLVGALVFIPFMNTIIGSNGGSIASGALTLTIILLPTIIKTTEESLKMIPNSYRQASLALGASRTQTVFKVILPNAIGGLLTATLLSIGRIIGESAALIYAVGTVIKDTVSITDRSTSLAVHIWSMMAGENPNFELASAIAILILLIVFILNITVKIISRRVDKTRITEKKEKRSGKSFKSINT